MAGRAVNRAANRLGCMLGLLHLAYVPGWVGGPPSGLRPVAAAWFCVGGKPAAELVPIATLK